MDPNQSGMGGGMPSDPNQGGQQVPTPEPVQEPAGEPTTPEPIAPEAPVAPEVPSESNPDMGGDQNGQNPTGGAPVM